MFNDDAKNEMLDALGVDRVQLHDGDPGSDGTANTVSGKVAATFSSASSGVRALGTDVDFTGLSPGDDVLYFSIWLAGDPDVFKGAFPITSGDTKVNAAGEYTLTTDTELRLVDPS